MCRSLQYKVRFALFRSFRTFLGPRFAAFTARASSGLWFLVLLLDESMLINCASHAHSCFACLRVTCFYSASLISSSICASFRSQFGNIDHLRAGDVEITSAEDLVCPRFCCFDVLDFITSSPRCLRFTQARDYHFMWCSSVCSREFFLRNLALGCFLCGLFLFCCRSGLVRANRWGRVLEVRE